MDKIRLLAIGDDIRFFSGMGIQLRKVLTGLLKTGDYDIAEVACSNVPHPQDMVEFEGIRLYPARDYGHMEDFRRILSIEHPQVVLALGDPRQFTQLFMMDNEVRPSAKFVLWHVWDNDPFPKFNAPLYAACDRIVTFSNFSHNLLKSGGVENDCITCSVDPTDFYTLPAEIVQQARTELFSTANGEPVNFLVFWNSRNGARKRLPEILLSFKRFALKHPDSMLFVNTDARDREGTDVITVHQDVEPTDAHVVFNFEKMTTPQLNLMYNMADVTADISFWEGFGLSIAESLAVGTPVICSKTGGMTEQVMTPEGEAGVGLDPVVRNLHGTLEVPYIFQDYVSSDQIVDALEKMYLTGILNRQHLGRCGQRHILADFSVDGMVAKFDKLIREEAAKPITFENWRVLTV